MNDVKRVVPVCGVTLTSLLFTGCFVEVRDEARPFTPTGSVTVEWTVANRTDPRACARFGGRQADFELLVYEGSREVARQYAPCEDFHVTVDLPPGEYTAYATLVNPNNDPVTSTLPLEDVRVVEDKELNMDVDFPTRSFL